jgi:hypothetical protein
MATYKIIASSEVGAGGASSVVFNNIPQVFTHLVVRLSSRGTTGGLNNVSVSLNGSGSYAGRRFYWSNTSLSADNAVSQWMGFGNASTHTSGFFSNNIIYFANYSKTTLQKPWITTTMTYNIGNTDGLHGHGANYNTMTDAITSMTFTQDNPFAQYSYIELYGLS